MNPTPKILASLLVAAPLSSGMFAHAEELSYSGRVRSQADTVAMSTSGSSGALNVPDGRVLPDGTLALGVNNAFDPQFANYARGQNYQFGLGLFPYVELSARVANYPINSQGDLGVRDLSANVKIAIPKIVRGQPDIAIGLNDLSGGVQFFRSKYLAVTDTFGPLRLNIGAAKGQPYLSRVFGSGELALWETGLSLLMERTNHANYAGLRYSSAPLGSLGDGQFVASAQRSVGVHAVDGRKVDHFSFGVNFVIPLGDGARDTARAGARPDWSRPYVRPAPVGSSVVSASVASLAPDGVASVPATSPVMTADSPPRAAVVPEMARSLENMRAELIKAGLERVRVGLRGAELVIEYENHRYNQNEVDALGIALGVGARLAPDSVALVSVVTKKAGLGLYQASVSRALYRQFLRDGQVRPVRSALTLRYRPDSDGVQWLDQADGPRGYSRVRIDPELNKFVATDVGVFDYALAANTQVFVPLWAGAELTTSYIRALTESDNVAHGFFSYAQQRNGLRSLIGSQAFWLGDRVVNVASAGKVLYDDTAIQNETTWFVPHNDDQVRVQYSRVKHKDIYATRVYDTGSAAYMWTYAPLDVSIEAAYNRYVGQGDTGPETGPSLRLSRWFGDVQAQLYMRRSNIESRAGFSLAFPLTPRQGMRPGLTHIEGAGRFPLALETQLAKNGSLNWITKGVLEEMPMVYSARSNLFNQGRVGKDYLLGQLPRMREAALIFSPIAQ